MKRTKAAERPAGWKRAAMAAILALSLGLTTACGNRLKAGVVVAGSTSVQPYAEILAEEYALSRPESEIDIQGGGSSAGITAAESGAADIGMSSRGLNENEQGFWSVEIAKDGLAIIIHPDNPIQSLTIEQVRDIYTIQTGDWSGLGWEKGAIHIIAREEGSGTRSAFESLVMGKATISPKAIVQSSNGAVRQLVADDPHSIGFISLGLVDHTVKAVELDGVAPTLENVVNGSYSLFRPFLFVMNGEPTGPAREWIDFILSPEGQRILSHEGLVPVTEGAEE